MTDRSNLKAWAKQHLVGVENTLLPSFTPDMKTLDEAGIRHDVRQSVAHGFFSTMVATETGLHFDEAKRMLEIAVDEAKGEILVTTSLILDSFADNLAMLEHAEAVGVNGVLLGYPRELPPDRGRGGVRADPPPVRGDLAARDPLPLAALPLRRLPPERVPARAARSPRRLRQRRGDQGRRARPVRRRPPPGRRPPARRLPGRALRAAAGPGLRHAVDGRGLLRGVPVARAAVPGRVLPAAARGQLRRGHGPLLEARADAQHLRAAVQPDGHVRDLQLAPTEVLPVVHRRQRWPDPAAGDEAAQLGGPADPPGLLRDRDRRARGRPSSRRPSTDWRASSRRWPSTSTPRPNNPSASSPTRSRSPS